MRSVAASYAPHTSYLMSATRLSRMIFCWACTSTHPDAAAGARVGAGAGAATACGAEKSGALYDPWAGTGNRS